MLIGKREEALSMKQVLRDFVEHPGEVSWLIFHNCQNIQPLESIYNIKAL
jgi:hypothetical protein